MFGRKAASGAEPTVIGRGAVIEGTVRANGPLQVDGQIEGTLHVAGQVSVGPTGSVIGELIADEIVVGGKVQGKVTARGLLHVAPSGSARGEVHYGALQIDRGGVIDGTTAHGQGAPEAEGAADAKRPSKVPPAPGSRPATVVS